MSARTIAIGDIHGCSAALAALVRVIDPQPSDTLVALGDYVDRGPDSRGVIDQLIALAKRCRLVPLLGNHEEMMLDAGDGRSDLRFWLLCGGSATLESYGADATLKHVPRAHFKFLAGCLTYHETDNHFFIHANYLPELPLDEQPIEVTRWLSLRDVVPEPHVSGKTAVVGHTPQDSGEILDLAYLKCIDTGCCKGGWLTALDVGSGRIWQANDRGELRK